jgi:hypothetical protein
MVNTNRKEDDAADDSTHPPLDTRAQGEAKANERLRFFELLCADAASGNQHNRRLPESSLLPTRIQNRHLAVILPGGQFIQ